MIEKSIEYLKEYIREEPVTNDMYNAIKDVIEEIEKLKRTINIKNGDIEYIHRKIDRHFIDKLVVIEHRKELEKQYELALDENSTKSFILKCQIEGFKDFEKEILEVQYE